MRKVVLHELLSLYFHREITDRHGMMIRLRYVLLPLSVVCATCRDEFSNNSPLQAKPYQTFSAIV